MPHSKTLDQIPQGESVRVARIDGDDPIAHRLRDLGVRDGVVIEVLRRAPFGDPTVFELCGYQLCLRRTETKRIHVAPAGRNLTDEAVESPRRPGVQ